MARNIKKNPNGNGSITSRSSTTSELIQGGEDQIRIRAYERFQERLSTGAEGDELSDWLCAERECLDELNRTRPTAVSAYP